ncbi:MAG: hypothetical protein ACI8XO_003129 [Verrucomicrobiales bacterium]
MSSASAQTQASSKPMGYVTYTALGNSDTWLSLPVHRKQSFVGKVDSLNGTNEIVVQGAPNWTANQFVQDLTDDGLGDPIQPDTYYVLIASGTNFEGRSYEVTANSANSLTIDVGGETISGAGNVENGTAVQLVPFWTLDTVFLNGDGVHTKTSAFGSNPSEVLLYDPSSIFYKGINPPKEETYFRLNTQWRRVGAGSSTFNHKPLARDMPLVLRHNISTATEVVNLGIVPTTAYTTVLQTLLNQTKQDNPVALNIPVPVTLAGSNLQNSGFEHSAGFSRRDELLVVHHTVADKNRPATDTYYYNNYWRKNGSGSDNFNDELVFTLDTSVIIRRATNPIGSVVWKMPRPYPVD